MEWKGSICLHTARTVGNKEKEKKKVRERDARQYVAFETTHRMPRGDTHDEKIRGQRKRKIFLRQ